MIKRPDNCNGVGWQRKQIWHRLIPILLHMHAPIRFEIRTSWRLWDAGLEVGKNKCRYGTHSSSCPSVRAQQI